MTAAIATIVAIIAVARGAVGLAGDGVKLFQGIRDRRKARRERRRGNK